MSRRGVIYYILLMIAVSGMSACKAPEQDNGEATPRKVSMTLRAEKSSNPGQNGRAAPIQMIVYSLLEADNFNTSDYFTLYSVTSPELAADIKKHQKYILKPGESRQLEMNLTDDVSYIGIVAGYRDINSAQWSAIYPLPRRKPIAWYKKLVSSSPEPLKLNVVIDTLSVSIKEAN